MEPTLLPVEAGDGHRFEARVKLAPGANAPLLVFAPAMGTWGRFYDRLGDALTEVGVSFVTCDWRGASSSNLRASRRTDWGYRELVEVDYHALYRAARAAAPEASAVWVGGHSLGGQVAALYAARDPEAAAGLMIIAAGSVHFRGWRGVAGARMLALTQSARVMSGVFGHFPGRRVGFAGRESRGVIRDWAACGRHGRFEPRGTDFDYEQGLANLVLPVRALGFAGDTLSPESSTRRLLGKLKRCEPVYRKLLAQDTGDVALDHFSWARTPDWAAAQVADWMLER